jgi:hypothetical protein
MENHPGFFPQRPLGYLRYNGNCGALVAHITIFRAMKVKIIRVFSNLPEKDISSDEMASLLLLPHQFCDSVLFCTILFNKKSRRDRKNFWTPVSRRLLINLLIPLAAEAFLLFHLWFRTSYSL